jgi:predicted dehydrogenase
MAERAAAAGVKHMVMYTFRWMPHLQYARDLIDQGYLGRVYHCEFRYLMGYARSREFIWRLDRGRANGILGDIGSHAIDTARWLVGEISAVSAQLGAFVERPGADGGPATRLMTALCCCCGLRTAARVSSRPAAWRICPAMPSASRCGCMGPAGRWR